MLKSTEIYPIISTTFLCLQSRDRNCRMFWAKMAEEGSQIHKSLKYEGNICWYIVVYFIFNVSKRFMTSISVWVRFVYVIPPNSEVCQYAKTIDSDNMADELTRLEA